mmetsp:Transcript_51741/g.92069  ORF Transcript_51741/g.92069 Transcript_51741/m.92069 type:complete len:460 (+) Transcript_51741:85-1464(+)
MDPIPEDKSAPVEDPKSIDGILARLSEIERRLDGKADVDLKKKVAQMEVSFKGISKDVLKHQEALIPIVEKEIARLTTDMEQGMARIRTEVVQITDQVANCAASSIERLLQDIANVTNRVDKWEKLQADTSLTLNRASADAAEAVSKYSKSRKDVVDNASTTSGSCGSAGSQKEHSANTKSTDSAGATRESSAVSDNGASTNSSDAKLVREAKMACTPSVKALLEKFEEKDIGWCSVPDQLHQDVAARLKNLAAAVERQVTGADWYAKTPDWLAMSPDLLANSTGSTTSCTSSTIANLEHTGGGSMTSWASSKKGHVARSCSPPASPMVDVSDRSIQLTTPQESPKMRYVSRDPLSALASNLPPRSPYVGGSFRVPVNGSERHTYGPSRSRASSVDYGTQKSMANRAGSFGSRSGPRRDATVAYSSTQRWVPQSTVVYEKPPMRTKAQVQPHCTTSTAI